MKLIIYSTLLLFYITAQARVVPINISEADINLASKKLSGLFSINTVNNPEAVGADFEFEITGTYQDLDTDEIQSLDSSVSKDFLDGIIALRKGLYWNIDFAISTALPIPSNLISGYSIGISRSSQIKSLFIKPELYIFQYELNDILNLSGTGLSLIAFKKIGLVYLGLGGNVESTSGEFEEKFLGGSTLTGTPKSKTSFVQATAMAKISFIKGRSRISISYNYKDEEKMDAGLSYALKF